MNGDSNGVEEPFASTSRATSILPQTTKPYASVNSYLVGSQLDEALASGQDISIFWPFADGEVSDWIQAEAIWFVLVHLSQSPTNVFFFSIGNMFFSTNYSAVASKMSPQFCYQSRRGFRAKPTNVYVKFFSKDSTSPVSVSSNGL